MDVNSNLKEIENSLNEISEYLLDIALSLRMISRRPDFVTDASEVYSEEAE